MFNAASGLSMFRGTSETRPVRPPSHLRSGVSARIPRRTEKIWSETMQNTHRTRMPTNQVTALYASRTLSFGLSKDATLADLADHLDQPDINGWHMDMPTAITLKFAIAREPSAILQAGI